MQVRHIFVSPGHNYFGRHGKPPKTHPTLEVEEVECVAGSGIRGDRFFGHRQDYKGQVTLFDWGVFQALRRELALPQAEVSALRRNLVVSGADLNAMVGQTFSLQGVMLLGTEECRPCYWMDRALGPGAEVWLKGRGGLRARVLSTGVVRKDIEPRRQALA